MWLGQDWHVLGVTLPPWVVGGRGYKTIHPPPSNELGRHGGARPFQCRQTLEVTKQEGF